MILQQQYALVQGSREAVLSFVETSIGEDLNTPVPAYDNKTIRDLLEHNAHCYFDWLVYFALQQPVGSLKDEGVITMPLIRRLYVRVDEVVTAFLGKFGKSLNVPINGVPEPRALPRNATPLQLFTNVVTHEFHNNEQIALMYRLFVYIPPTTTPCLAFL